MTQSNGTTTSSTNDKKTPLHQGDVLHVIDSRTGQYHAIRIDQNSINASDLKALKAPKDAESPEYQNEQGLRVYDPGYSNTLVSESRITYM